jgi:hypothetical protein
MLNHQLCADVLTIVVIFQFTPIFQLLSFQLDQILLLIYFIFRLMNVLIVLFEADILLLSQKIIFLSPKLPFFGLSQLFTDFQARKKYVFIQPILP